MSSSTSPLRSQGESVHSAIVQAVHRSWWNVDQQHGLGNELLYTDDGVFVTRAMTMAGRAEIAHMYSARKANGPRLSRHLVSNLVTEVVDDYVCATYVIVLYARNGLTPLTLEPPTMIADATDQFVLSQDRWLIRRRTVEPVFVAADNDSVLLQNR